MSTKATNTYNMSSIESKGAAIEALLKTMKAAGVKSFAVDTPPFGKIEAEFLPIEIETKELTPEDKKRVEDHEKAKQEFIKYGHAR